MTRIANEARTGSVSHGSTPAIARWPKGAIWSRHSMRRSGDAA
jgi:hypothetical protein